MSGLTEELGAVNDTSLNGHPVRRMRWAGRNADPRFRDAADERALLATRQCG
nr:hypothetical protein [Escherichia coli]